MKCLQLFLVAVFLCYMTASGQKDKKSEPRIYAFDEKGNNVNDINKAATYEVLISENDTTHILRVYKNFGPMIKQESYLDKDLTIPNGRFVWYNVDGRIDSTGVALKGKKEGAWEYFNCSTWKNKEGKYIDSLIMRKYYSNGKLNTQNEHIAARDSTKANFSEQKSASKGWQNYLTSNLNASIGELILQYPAIKKEGKAEVIVCFSILTDGKVGDMYLSQSKGYPFDNEVLRVIGNSKNWSPAQKDGHPVVYRQRQAITFTNNR